MAQISNKHLFTFNPEVWGNKLGQRVTVGHNRQIQLSDRENVLSFFLHGHCIMQAHVDDIHAVEIYLDHCGYLTVTTCRAMGDFLKACGIRASVSRAKGDLTGRYIGNGGEAYAMTQSCGFLKFYAPKGSKLCVI